MGRTFIITEKQYKFLTGEISSLNEANSSLLSSGHDYPIPPKLLKHLENVYNNIKNQKNIDKIDGFKRLKNMLENKSFNYNTLRRIKNFFDTFRKSNKDTKNDLSFYLNGGVNMENWINSTLDQAENSVKNVKSTMNDNGIDNSFVKYHTKDNNPTKLSNINPDKGMITYS